MPIYKLSRPENTWLVSVQNRKFALSGFGRVKVRVVGTREDAEAKELEVSEAIRSYGMFPIPLGASPRNVVTTPQFKSQSRNIENAFELATKSLWVGRRSQKIMNTFAVEALTYLLTTRNVTDLNALTTADVLAYRASLSHCSASTVNSKLSALRMVLRFCCSTTPALMEKMVIVNPLPRKRTLKWWLAPADLPKVKAVCDEEPEHLSELYDYICWAILTGLRVEETLRVTKDHIQGLGTNKPTLTVPGLKTSSAQKAIPLFGEAARLAEKRIMMHPYAKTLFPFSYDYYVNRWRDLRVAMEWDNSSGTCTLKALRRTFARVCKDKGLQAFSIQRLLRHADIGTTQGYLDLTGDDAVESIRDEYETGRVLKRDVVTY
jgi:integrase